MFQFSHSFSLHIVSVLVFLFVSMTVSNRGVGVGGGGAITGSSCKPTCRHSNQQKDFYNINATHPYATVALKMLLHDHCDSNNQMSERTHVPRRPCYIFFVRIASLVETQYLVSAIRQFSSEVECTANGLLMFSTVFSLEKNRTIQTQIGVVAPDGTSKLPHYTNCLLNVCRMNMLVLWG